LSFFFEGLLPQVACDWVKQSPSGFSWCGAPAWLVRPSGRLEQEPGDRVRSVRRVRSTLIACEKTGRQARLIELDPKYCDLIVRRWQEFSGGTGTLEGDGRSFDEIPPRCARAR
jgi:hypothetical protein